MSAWMETFGVFGASLKSGSKGGRGAGGSGGTVIILVNVSLYLSHRKLFFFLPDQMYPVQQLCLL